MRQYFFLVIFSAALLVGCTPSHRKHNVYITISKGDSFSKVLNYMVNRKIVRYPKIFKLLAKLNKTDTSLKVGTFIIPSGASYWDMLRILSNGIDAGQVVTIPEGFNVFQIAYLLEQKEIVTAIEFLTEVYSSPYLEEFGIPRDQNYIISAIRKLEDKNGYIFMIPSNPPPEYSLEGYLFPDTYNFPKSCSAHLVIKTFIKRFREVVNQELQKEIHLSNKTLHQVITLASIIEKEATNRSEMRIISGVFHNRLKTKMRMQASPTLIYALILEGIYRGNIAKSHLNPPWPSRYNTDYVPALPIGPIANPGKAAILSAIRPVDHDYYYFCRNPEGYHTFSKTLDQHNKVVYRWRKYRRNWRVENS